MQKKQVKIMGFQSENCKIKLFYETDEENSRYIVERNRKYIITTKDLNKAKKKFTTEINNEVLQLNLLEQESKKQEEPIAIHDFKEGDRTRCFKFIEIDINEYNELWKSGKYKLKGGGYYVRTNEKGKYLY